MRPPYGDDCPPMEATVIANGLNGGIGIGDIGSTGPGAMVAGTMSFQRSATVTIIADTWKRTANAIGLPVAMQMWDWSALLAPP